MSASPAIRRATSIAVAVAVAAASACSSSLPPGQPGAPGIIGQPQDQVAAPGYAATFTVSAIGTGTLTYGWRMNGVAIPGANQPSYTTAPVALADDGTRFSVVVADAFGGSAVSDEATLRVEGFVPTGVLSTARSFHTATLLPSGKVLVAGGTATAEPYGTATAELYDPATERWSATGSLSTARARHTATLLPSGKVLVTGGDRLGASAELFDPATGTWTPTAPMSAARSAHTATLLDSGVVLVVGGDGGRCLSDPCDAGQTAEIYDPGPETWSSTARPMSPRSEHTATLLASGKVLLAGGGRISAYAFPGDAPTEVFDPEGTWTTLSYIAGKPEGTATLLDTGEVLLAGGIGFYSRSSSVAAWSSLFGQDGSTSMTGSLSIRRARHTASLLPSGKVLAAGGCGMGNYFDCYEATSTVERYDRATGTWSAAGPLLTARFGHTATVLPSGRLLVVGGSTGASHLASAELWVRP